MNVSQIVTLSGISYLVHPQTLARVASNPSRQLLQPSVLVSEASICSGNLADVLEGFARSDDVYSPDFSRHVVLQARSVSCEAARKTSEGAAGNTGHPLPQPTLSCIQTKSVDLPQGPYFIHGNEVHQAWRLYPDYLGAFVATVIPDNPESPSSFSIIQALSEDGQNRVVAVPSRLYYKHKTNLPLAGLRVSIKDNMDMRGIKTTLMSRAYSDLYPPRTESAAVVHDLISKGAVIVGKTKLAAFASAEEPTDQWVDYHAPFNPRGDLYQIPSGSSTGAAVSLAGYDWLDFSLGTDTTGSIRAPASWNGLFALRPSWGVTKLGGIATRCQAFDTVGFLSRDSRRLKEFTRNLAKVTDFTKYPRKVLYPRDYFPVADAKQQSMIDGFIQILQDFLGVEITHVDIQDRWMKCMPKEAEGKPLQKYLHNSAYWPMYYDLFQQTADFRHAYQKKFGKNVFVGPYVRWSWDMAKNLTLPQKQQGLAQMNIFRDWFQKNIMGPDSETGSDALLLMPSGQPGPRYRDEINALVGPSPLEYLLIVVYRPPKILRPLSEYYLAPVLGMPQIVFPVGQNPYTSRVSGNVEYRPIMGSLIGASGSDLMLIDLVHATLMKAGWPTAVATGQQMFPVSVDNNDSVVQVAHEALREQNL